MRLRDGKLTVEEAEAKIGDNKDRPNAPYMKGSTAVIPILGPLAKKMNLFTAISGGTSYEMLQKNIQEALDDKKVKDILFDVDSPGGSVDGLFDLADFMLGCRDKKPMRALANGMMTSAAYLLGSSANEVMATSASIVGSIGVITAHYDYSKAQEMQGVKKTYLYSGRYKAMGHDSEPLTDEARKYIQSQLDHYYTMFVDAVAENRGVDKDTVLSKMADGKIFIGEQAMEGGLIDGIGTFDKLVTVINPSKRKEVKLMPVNEFKKEHPQEYLELVNKTKQEAADEVRAEMQGQIDDKNKVIDQLEKENETLSGSLADSEKRMLKLEKNDALRTEREMKKDADRIWADELAASDIPARLHPKVSNQVSHEKFIKEGVFDRDGFKEAIQAEMKDWKGVGTETVIGGAAPLKGEGEDADAQTQQKEDDDAVDEMLNMAESERATQH
jgi:signal peptide peptidase SppA